MKRLLSFVLAMAMFISCVQWSAMPLMLTAWGEGDTSTTYTDASGTVWVDFETVLVGDNWLGGFYNVPAGNYYLSDDCDLDRGLIIKADVTLDLNDHILTIDADQAWADDNTVSDAGIVIYGGNLTLVDNNATTARYWDGDSIETGTNPAADSETTNFVGGAITGGYNDRSVLGGGAICIQSGSLTMTNANLVGNATSTTGILGGAVYVNANGTFTMNSGSIIGNTSGGLAGAVYVQCNGTFILNDGVIAHNSTGTTANYAGAVYNVGTFTMYDGLIDSNESMGGGAVSTVAGWKAGSGVFTMYGGSITNNYATTAAGAVLVGSGGSFVMYSGDISGNTTSGAGGAMNLLYENSTVTLYGGSITNNTAVGVAGGIRVNGGTLNIGQTGSTPIVIDNNTGDGAESNVYLFSGSAITQVGGLDGSCSIGVTLETGMGTAALSSTSPAYAITAADTTYYSSDAGYYRILDGEAVILLEAGEIPGGEATVEYDGNTIDITALDGLFDLSERHGTATYTLADTGTGVGTLTSDGVLTVTQVGTFDIEISTSYTTTAEPKTGSATLVVTPTKDVTIVWPTAAEMVPVGGNQKDDATIDQATGSASLTDADDNVITVDGTFYWLNPNTETQDAGDYTGTVYFVPDEKYDGAYDKYFTALTGELGYSVAAPTPAVVLTSTNVTVTYGADAIDVSNIGLFDATEIATVLAELDDAGTGYTVAYTVTPVTGAGSVDGTSLSVSTVGDFTVTLTIATETLADSGYIASATLRVEPKEVVITALATETRGPVQNYYDVTLDSVSGSITGVTDGDTGIIDGDDVAIDFSAYTATIDDKTYDSTSNTAYDANGEGSFAVTVSALALTGADAANYTVVRIDPTDVTIKMSIPYIAWPAATTITYGETQKDSTLYGGKVVMLDATTGEYVEITALGDFEWVDPSTAVQTTGTYTGTVQFVLDTTADGYDALEAAVVELLNGTTREVDYLIEAAPVVFSISDNSVAYGSYAVPTITVVSSGTADAPTADDYTVQYLQLVDGAYVYVTSPTEVGTYFVGIGFNSTGTDANGNLLYEYYHTGANVSTAKQIGVLVIYEYEEIYLSDGSIEISESLPNTYSLSFTGFAAADGVSYDVSAALPQTIHILPTLDTDVYLGWEDAQGIFYSFGSRYAQPEYDMTFTAVLAADNHTISGIATGQDIVGDADDTPLSGIGVVLMSGNDQIATTETNENGYYSFSVMPGRYTVEFTRDYGTDKNIESVFADASEGDTVVNVYFPDGVYNVSLSLAAGMDGITVDGLQSLLSELSNGKITPTSVVFAINQVDVAANEYLDIMDAATDDGLTSDNIKLFYDVQITKDDADVDAVNTRFAIYIPLSGIYQAKESYTVYRSDGSTVDLLTSAANSAGEYIKLVDNGQTLVIYAKESALYAISFTEPAPGTLEGEDVTKEYSTAAIDVSTLGMFDLSGLGTATYTITPVTGEGTIVGDYLKVSSVGTFTVTVTTAASATASAMQGTATLTITPKEIAVADLVGVERGPVEGNYYVELDADASSESNTLIGVINSDDVSVDFASYADAYGRIVDEDYTAADNYIVSDGESTTIAAATFDIAAGGLMLDGTDSANYLLSDAAGTVEINVSEPYIAWPTAPDINYHDDLSDSTLYGGKVVVLDTATGEYVQLAGSFEWLNLYKWVDEAGNVVTSTSIDTTDIGTYTQYVKFVEDIDTEHDLSNTTYRETLASTVHAVSVTIKATSVSFAVTGSDVVYDGEAHYVTVKATASSDEALTEGTAGDYVIQYYQFGDDGSIIYVDEPTDVGTYYVAAYFTSTNYHHTGTLESTGKQIGVLYIRAADSAATLTYSITFENAGDDWAGYTTSGIYAQDIHNLPTITDADGNTSTEYIGWLYNGSVYDFGARLAQPAADITLTPVAAAASYAVSGTVYGEDLDGTQDAALSNVAVAVMQGAQTIATLETDANGYFSADLPAGEYTVIITRDQVVYNEVSIHIEVVDKAVVLDDIVLPDVAQNTVLEIASGVAVTSVDGLDDILDYYLAKEEYLLMPVSNTITVEINNIDITGAQQTEYTAIMAAASDTLVGDGNIAADYLKLFFDVGISHTESGVTTQISTVPEDDAEEDVYLEIYVTLPGTYQGYGEYVVYRYHDGAVDTLTMEENDAGEGITLLSDGQTLVIKTKYDSVYGIAYLPPVATTLVGEDVTQTYSAVAIDVSTAGLFDNTETNAETAQILADAAEAGLAITYTITEGTGEGTVDGNSLSVSKVGTFTVTVTVAGVSDTDGGYIGSATLTIEPKLIDVYGIVGVSRGAAEGDDYVEIDADASDDNYTLVGLINNDSVSLVYDDAYGRIYVATDAAEYTDASYYDTETNLATFDIMVGGLALAGDDKDNYILDDISGKVVISIATPYIAWPTAPDITYGQDLTESVLYGGKVIVYDGDLGDYVTLTGSFTWVNSAYWVKEVVDADGNTSLSVSETAIDTTSIGSYSQYVTFTPSDDAYDGKYDALLTDIYHEIDVLIKATSVQFSVSDNDVVYKEDTAQYPTVTATASVADTLTASDYVIVYYQFNADGGIDYFTSPTEVGTYYVAAYFNSTNYHHAGTLESTAKQIGVFVIRAEGSDETTTYPTRFAGYESFNFDDSLAQTIHILPTITETDDNGNAVYVGWSYNGSVYEFGARFGQPAIDVEFTAVAAPASYEVYGAVYGVDLNGDVDAALSNIAVAVMQGSETVATLETGADGTFSVYLPAGEYTVVITRDQVVYNEVSIHVEVVDGAVALGDIVLPDVAQNTVLEIASGVPVNSVDGIGDVSSYYASEAASSTVSSTVMVDINNIDSEVTHATEHAEIMAAAADDFGAAIAGTDFIVADYVKLFFDVSIWYTYGSDDPVQISVIPDDLDNPNDGYLEIYITLPGTYQGYAEYVVYRYHDGAVDALTMEANDAGEGITLLDGGQTLVIKAKYYSVFAVAFSPLEAITLAGEDVTVTYGADAIDVSTAGLFNNAETNAETAKILEEAEAAGLAITYTIEEGTGEGNVDGNNLTVSSIGTFTVTVTIEAASTADRSYTGSATLTVTAKEISVTDLVGVSRIAEEGYDYVELNADASDESYNLIGVVNEDGVSIDVDSYADAEGRITDETYADASNYNTQTNRATFDITATGLALAGEDAGNYILTDMTGTVTISIVTPDSVTLPTATNITYGETLIESTLDGGEVVVYDGALGEYVTLTGTFTWVNRTYWLEETSTDNAEQALSFTGAAVSTTDIGTYSQYVKFTPDDSSYSDLFASTYYAVDVQIESSAVQFAVSDNNVAYTGTAQYPTIVASTSSGTLSASDYVIQYYQLDADGNAVAVENPTDIGAYYVTAYFTSDNYHHADTLNGAELQIGVFTIYGDDDDDDDDDDGDTDNNDDADTDNNDGDGSDDDAGDADTDNNDDDADTDNNDDDADTDNNDDDADDDDDDTSGSTSSGSSSSSTVTVTVTEVPTSPATGETGVAAHLVKWFASVFG